jgi:hypothetical protein
MATEAGMDKIKCELHRAMDCMRSDLTRVEILTAALSAFSRPIPDYEPAFHHVHRIKLSAHELGAKKQR